MYFIGIDIGGTKIKGVVFDAKNKLIKKEITFKTSKNKKDFLKQLGKIISELEKGNNVKGIGVGLPGVVGYLGVLVKAQNLPFLNNWNARDFFSARGGSALGGKKYKIPVKFDNDSRCFLRAEAKLGAGCGYKNIVGLTIGTGIGGGIIIDGKMYQGKTNSAGEFGHTIFQEEKRNGKEKSFEELGGKKAFFKFGDRSKIVGTGVANLINTIDPDIVILGGGGINNGSLKMDVIKRVAKKYIMSPLAKKTPIVKGKLGDKAQVIGAALLFNEK
ncbi:MAG: ROK family protein [Candidatus Wolfebacteria bacterium]|nr:ROK family protein [Candidatus Wolfebacteria bacterium]